MRLKLEIRKVDEQCSSKVITLEVLGDIDIWLCVSVRAKFLWWSRTESWAIHLV